MRQEQSKDYPWEDYILKTKSDKHLLKAWHHGWWPVMLVYFPSCSWASGRVMALRGDNLLCLASSSEPTSALWEDRQLLRADWQWSSNGRRWEEWSDPPPLPLNILSTSFSLRSLFLHKIRLFINDVIYSSVCLLPPSLSKIEAFWRPKPCLIFCHGPAPGSRICCMVGIK